jgi:Fe-S-cluster containining protein
MNDTFDETAGRVRMKDDGAFSFACHPALSCWSDCCATDSLFLTPYDVLRLKNRLDLDSSSFLADYTSVVIDPAFGTPLVRLTMSETTGRCPFATGDGCALYADRPTGCRVYPLGHGPASGRPTATGGFYFKVENHDHCKGWDEPVDWTLARWIDAQELDRYAVFNDAVDRLSFPSRLGIASADEAEAAAERLMDLYDLDRLRGGGALPDLPDDADDETALTYALTRIGGRIANRAAAPTK